MIKWLDRHNIAIYMNSKNFKTGHIAKFVKYWSTWSSTDTCSDLINQRLLDTSSTRLMKQTENGGVWVKRNGLNAFKHRITWHTRDRFHEKTRNHSLHYFMLWDLYYIEYLRGRTCTLWATHLQYIFTMNRKSSGKLPIFVDIYVHLSVAKSDSCCATGLKYIIRNTYMYTILDDFNLGSWET